MKQFKVIFNDRKLKTVYITAEKWSIDIQSGFTYFYRDPSGIVPMDIPVAGISSNGICIILEVEDGKRK